MTRRIGRGYNGEMRYLALILFVAAGLGACNNAVIGPVDHRCASNPSWEGSGCSEHGHGH